MREVDRRCACEVVVEAVVPGDVELVDLGQRERLEAAAAAPSSGGRPWPCRRRRRRSRLNCRRPSCRRRARPRRAAARRRAGTGAGAANVRAAPTALGWLFEQLAAMPNARASVPQRIAANRTPRSSHRIDRLCRGRTVALEPPRDRGISRGKRPCPSPVAAVTSKSQPIQRWISRCPGSDVGKRRRPRAPRRTDPTSAEWTGGCSWWLRWARARCRSKHARDTRSRSRGALAGDVRPGRRRVRRGQRRRAVPARGRRALHVRRRARSGFAVCDPDGGGGYGACDCDLDASPYLPEAGVEASRRRRRRERRGGGGRARSSCPRAARSPARPQCPAGDTVRRLPREGPVLLASPCKEATDCPPPSPGCNMHGRVQGAVRTRARPRLPVSRRSSRRRSLAPTIRRTASAARRRRLLRRRREPVAEVRVIGDKADALQKVPGSGTLVTTQGDRARSSRPTSPRCSGASPGLTATQQESGGLRLDVGIHGLDPGRSRRVLILEDGVPVSVNPYAEPDIYYVPTVERMRGVEVVKGSGNILFGPQTIGGVINFLTLAAARPPPRDGRDRRRLLGRRPVRLERSVPARQQARGLRERPREPRRRARPSTSATSCRSCTRTSDGMQAEGVPRSTDALGKVVFDTSRARRGDAQARLPRRRDDVRRQRPDARRCTSRTRGSRRSRLPTASASSATTSRSRRCSASTTNTKLTTLAYAYRTQRIWNRAGLRPQHAGRRAPAARPVRLRRRATRASPAAPSTSATPTRSSTATTRWPGVEPRLEWRARDGRDQRTRSTSARASSTRRRTTSSASGSTPTSNDGTLDYVFDHDSWAFATYAEDRLEVRDWLLVTPGVRFEEAYFSSNVLAPGGRGHRRSPANGQAGGVIPGIGMVAGTPKANVYAGMHVGWAPPRITSPISPKTGTDVVQLAGREQHQLRARHAPHLQAAAALRGDGVPHRLQQPGRLVERRSGDLGRDRADQRRRDAPLRRRGRRELRPRRGARPPADGHRPGRCATRSRARTSTAAPTTATGCRTRRPRRSSGRSTSSTPRASAGQVAWTYVGAQFTDAQNTLAPDATGRVGKIPAYQTVDVMLRYKLARHGPHLQAGGEGRDERDVHLRAAARRDPVGGFRQILAGVRWDWDEKPAAAAP